jgi:hypothetical protein
VRRLGAGEVALREEALADAEERRCERRRRALRIPRTCLEHLAVERDRLADAARMAVALGEVVARRRRVGMIVTQRLDAQRERRAQLLLHGAVVAEPAVRGAERRQDRRERLTARVARRGLQEAGRLAVPPRAHARLGLAEHPLGSRLHARILSPRCAT